MDEGVKGYEEEREKEGTRKARDICTPATVRAMRRRGLRRGDGN